MKKGLNWFTGVTGYNRSYAGWLLRRLFKRIFINGEEITFKKKKKMMKQ